MPIHSDNLNLNLNLNLGASAGGGGVTGYGRPRFNTEDMDKLMPVNPLPTVKVPTLTYSDNWDPELRAWAYVYEFMTACPWKDGGGTVFPPVTFLQNAIKAQTGFPVPDLKGTLNPANKLTDALMSDQVVQVDNAALDRADRFNEILDQATGAGALNYWTGLLRIDPSQEKSTFLLMLVARKIGEYVAMGLKDIYKMRRPSQVYPFLDPMIDPPDTPSFPSSHSLQAHLISYVMIDALPNPSPKLEIDATANPPYVQKYPTAAALILLADRVARNREIAGLHYSMDSLCGVFAAQQCILQLRQLGGGSLYQTLLGLAKTELKDWP